MKKLLSLVVAGSLITTTFISGVTPINCFQTSVYASTNEIKVTIDGQIVDFSKYGTYPKIVDGTTYVPLRSLFESLDATELTDNEENYIGNYPVNMNEIYSFKKNVDGFEVYFTLDAKEKMQPFNSYYMVNYRKDGQSATLDLAGNNLILENGRTYLPLKAVSQAFGYEVSWNGNTKTVSIDTSNPTCEGMTIVDGYLNKTNNNVNNEANVNTTQDKTNISNTVTNTSTTKSTTVLTRLEQNQIMLEKVNAIREENELNPLVLDDKLMELAFTKAEDYNQGGYSSTATGKNGYSGNHISPRYGNPIEMYKTMYGEDKDIWENYAKGTTPENDVTEFFYNWETSEGHLRAMLRPNLTKMGFGYAEVENYGSYGTFVAYLEMY